MLERFPSLSGPVAILTLITFVTASLGGEEIGYFQWYGVAGLVFYGIVCAAALLVYLLVTRLPKEDFRQLYTGSVGWLPSLVGVVVFYWCRNQTWNGGNLPDKEFFSIAAQVLPVLILASIVDIGSSDYLSNGQLFPSVMAATIGEYVCLKVCAYPTEISGRTFAVPVAALVIVGITLVMGIAARWQDPSISLRASPMPMPMPIPNPAAAAPPLAKPAPPSARSSSRPGKRPKKAQRPRGS